MSSRSFRQSLLGGAALVLVSVIGAGAAQATVFGGSAQFTDNTTGNALDVTAVAPNPAPFTTGNMIAGQSDYMTGFMTLKTTDSASGPACFFGCLNTDNISLTFDWTQPGTATDTFGGIVSETTFTIGSFDSAQLKWTNDTHHDSNGSYAEQTVNFADGAVAYIDLYDANVSGTTTARSAQFDVRITDHKDPIPEPMSAALLGAGMIGIGAVRRRSQRATV
jgi:hypothetical protein